MSTSGLLLRGRLLEVVVRDGERADDVHDAAEESSDRDRKPDGLHVAAGDEEDM